MTNDPKIKVSDALALYGGNQSALASALGVSRGAVWQYEKEKRVFLPALQGYRIKAKHPDIPDSA